MLKMFVAFFFVQLLLAVSSIATASGPFEIKTKGINPQAVIVHTQITSANAFGANRVVTKLIQDYKQFVEAARRNVN